MPLSLPWSAPALLMASLFAVSPQTAAAAGVGPSFDCHRATSRNEKMICANPELARLDRQIAMRYKDLLSRMDEFSAEKLREDQKWFLTGRDDSYLLDVSPKILAMTLSHRLAFLDGIVIAQPPDVVGHWRNVTGEIVVTRGSAGALEFEAYTSEPSTGRWVCEARGPVTAAGPGRWTAAITEPARDVIELEIRGSRLVVNGRAPEPGYCGHNGSVSGDYFAMRGPLR